MNWEEVVSAGEQCLSYLRASAHGVLLLCQILVSITFLYILFRMCWFFLRFLERTVFSNPW